MRPIVKPTGPSSTLPASGGILQTDGYEGYRKLARGGVVRLAFCWAHVRRRFVELARAGPAPIATEALARIAALYQIEAEIRGRTPQERRAIRQVRSRPLMDALEPWLRECLALVSRKSMLAEALRYPLARWEGLRLILDDGRVEIDSNTVERSIRPLPSPEKTRSSPAPMAVPSIGP